MELGTSPSPPRAVLTHFEPHTCGLTWQRAPAGFSGAVVWRGDDDAPRVALKAWPVGVARERVQQVHAWQAQVAALPFVPRVFAGAHGETVCAVEGRVWDCQRWQPGAPRLSPATTEVETACAAVAQLHSAWASVEVGPCPGVRNRWRVLVENEPLLRAGPDALPAVAPELDPLLRRAVVAAQRCAPQLTAALREWETRPVALQPCVRDLRAEHVLFEEDRVAGIVDFGAMAVDSPAVDLARLFTDYSSAQASTSPLAGEVKEAAPFVEKVTRDELYRVGITAYRRARAACAVPDELLLLLMRSGLVGSVLGWLVRLAVRREPVSAVTPVQCRLARLLEQMEQISPF